MSAAPLVPLLFNAEFSWRCLRHSEQWALREQVGLALCDDIRLVAGDMCQATPLADRAAVCAAAADQRSFGDDESGGDDTVAVERP